MSRPAHVYEIYVRAPITQVWDAITDPEYTRRYFHRTAVTSSFEEGAPIRYVMADGSDAVEGTVVEVEPPHRLVITWHALYDAALAEEPPSRVEWTLREADEEGSLTRVTLRHGGLGLSPGTWENVRLGWVEVLDGMKTLLETGEPMGSVTTGFDPAPEDIDAHWHRGQAVAANNEAWRHLESLAQSDGTGDQAADAERLLEAAYAAAYHWRRAEGAGPVNEIRAAWMVSRAWTWVPDGAQALAYAERSLALCAEHGIKDFDLAYAHEARARALALLGRHDESQQAKDTASSIPIDDADDRRIFTDDLASPPWPRQ